LTKVLVTGSSGLIGNETVRFFAKKKFEVIGIDNNFRKLFFGQDGDTESISSHLQSDFANFSFNNGDIRDAGFINTLFENHKAEIDLIIHAAAQPSHDWAARK
jgi:CDP-paratose 2-epimerase